MVFLFLRDGSIFCKQKMRAVDEKNLENLLLKQIAKLPLTKIHTFFHSIDLKNTELYLLQLHLIYIFFKYLEEKNLY